MPARLRMVLIGVAACVAAAVVGVALGDREGERRDLQPGPSGFVGSVRPPGARAPEFSLKDAEGRVATLAQTRGKPAVFTFVYSTCEDTCPLQVQQIRGALDQLDGTDVPVLAVSVDPANDTPARARAFTLEQRMTGRMRFLLGTRRELAPVWRAFGIAPQRGELDHSAYVVLVDGAGRQRVGFPASQLTPEDLAHDITRLRTSG